MSPVQGMEKPSSRSPTPQKASTAEAQVIILTPFPLRPARIGTTNTVSVEMKEAWLASVVSRPCA